MKLAIALLLLSSTAAFAEPVGSISGTIIFEGDAPARTDLKRDTDPYCAKTPKQSEDVVVTNKKVKDVLVRIKNGTTGAHTSPSEPVVIDQRECMYAPRVIGMMPNQKVVVRNSDNTFHNVHGTIGGKLAFNKPQTPKADDLKVDGAPKAGDVLELQCDVHDWMHAWVVVNDSPFFAVTGEDGKFTISGLEPGTYDLEAWHPKLGTRSITVKIGTGNKAKVTAQMSYKP